MKKLSFLFLILWLRLSLCQNSFSNKNATNKCLDISSTIFRASCKQSFTIYPIILLDHDDDAEAESHFQRMLPMLEPCTKMFNENKTEHESLVMFRATSSVDDEDISMDCDYKTFEEVSNMTSFSEVYPKAPKAPYSHFTSFNWGLNDMHIMNLIETIRKLEYKCHGTNNSLYQPVILILTNMESNYAAVKFQDMERRFTKENQQNLSRSSIMMKIIWTKTTELTDSVKAYLEEAKQQTQGYISWVIDDMNNDQSVADNYGMCAENPGEPEEPTPKNITVPVMSGVGGFFLFLLILCVVIGIIFTQTNWLNRPAYVFFRFLEDRLKIKFKFLVRIHQDITDAGFERYVQEYTRGQDEWEVDPANLHISTELLGSGASAVVYKGILSGVPPIVKLFPKARLMGIYSTIENPVAIKRPHENGGAEERIEFLQEIRFMKTLNFHPHILTMLGCYFYPFQPLIVTELCELGDLLTLVRELGDPKTKAQCPIELEVLPVMAWQVCDALSFLAAINIIHRDVAARNILVSSAKIAKLSDFGLCRRANDLMYSGKKTGKMPLKWMAPEAIEKAEYSHKSDIWSYGVLLYEVFSFGTVPYPTISSEAVLEFIKKGNRLEVPHDTPEWMEELMESCWRLLPSDRPNASDLKTYLYSKIEAGISGYGYLQMSELDEMEVDLFMEGPDEPEYEIPLNKKSSRNA